MQKMQEMWVQPLMEGPLEEEMATHSSIPAWSISWEIDGETVETVADCIFWAPKSLQMVTAAMKLKDTYSLKKSYDQPRQHIKKQRHYFANKGLSSQGYGFSCGHVWM